MLCPACNIRLERTAIPNLCQGGFWRRLFKTFTSSPEIDLIHHACKKCDGRALTPYQLCITTDEDYVREIWEIAEQGSWLRKRPCPSCRELSPEVLLSHQNLFLSIDICKNCELIWFDHLEFEQLSKVDQYESREERLAELEAHPGNYFYRIRLEGVERPAYEHSHFMNCYAGNVANESRGTIGNWKILAMTLGLPVEWKSVYRHRFPIFTYLLCAAVAAVSIFGFSQPKSFFLEFGFVPSSAWNTYGITMLTSFFLHGGWFHLLSNLYFLLVFGDDVEDYLGKIRYLTLIVIGTLAGGGADLLTRQNLTLPAIGASHGISAILAFYAFTYPRRTIGLPLLFIPLRLTARTAFLFWLLFQFVGIFIGVFSESRIGYAAHLGGVIGGCLCALLWAKPPKAYAGNKVIS